MRGLKFEVDNKMLKRSVIILRSIGKEIEMFVKVGYLKKSYIPLIDHESEVNLMSRRFYGRGKWPIDLDAM